MGEGDVIDVVRGVVEHGEDLLADGVADSQGSLSKQLQHLEVDAQVGDVVCSG